MAYYVDEKKLRDSTFETKLDFYKDTDTKSIIDLPIDPQIKETYNINIRAEKGYLSYLNDLNINLKSSEAKEDTYIDNIKKGEESLTEARKKVYEAHKSLKKAKQERFEAPLFSKEEAAANEKVKQANEAKKQAKENRAKAKQTLEKYHTEYKAYLEKLDKSRAKKQKIEDQIKSCKSQNKRIITETEQQIQLVTEFKIKVELLDGKIKEDKDIRVGNHILPAGDALTLLKKFSDGLTVSLAKPLKSDSLEFRMLTELEQQALENDHQQTYQDGVTQKQTEISSRYEEYEKQHTAYNDYIFREDSDEGR